jgi:hypothetical protein
MTIEALGIVTAPWFLMELPRAFFDTMRGLSEYLKKQDDKLVRSSVAYIFCFGSKRLLNSISHYCIQSPAQLPRIQQAQAAYCATLMIDDFTHNAFVKYCFIRTDLVLNKALRPSVNGTVRLRSTAGRMGTNTDPVWNDYVRRNRTLEVRIMAAMLDRPIESLAQVIESEFNKEYPHVPPSGHKPQPPTTKPLPQLALSAPKPPAPSAPKANTATLPPPNKNSPGRKGWTDQETAKLSRLGKKHEKNGVVDWVPIQKEFPDRTLASIRSKWYRINL